MSAVLKVGGAGSALPRHFLEIMDHDAPTLRRMLDLATAAKRGAVAGRPLAGKNVALIFATLSVRSMIAST